MAVIPPLHSTSSTAQEQRIKRVREASNKSAAAEQHARGGRGGRDGKEGRSLEENNFLGAADHTEVLQLRLEHLVANDEERTLCQCDE
jgi:hypothetical protein